MECKYDYSLSSVILTPFLISGKSDYSQRECQEALVDHLAEALRNITDDVIQEPDYGEFEINSHSIAFVDDNVVLSVVFQRLKQ